MLIALLILKSIKLSVREVIKKKNNELFSVVIVEKTKRGK